MSSFMLFSICASYCTLSSVMYSYVGTDDQFDDFLKMMIHDYLSVDHPYTNRTADFVAKVETEVA